MGIAIAVFAASIPLTPLYKKIGQEFMPPLNEGDLLFMPVLLPGASISQAKEAMAKQDWLLQIHLPTLTRPGALHSVAPNLPSINFLFHYLVTW